jgi:Ca2+-binding RTX toxin-like protein
MKELSVWAFALAVSAAIPLNSMGLARAEAPAPCDASVATIVGTPGHDALAGTAGDDAIYADAGSDRVDAMSGDDAVCGGEGNDILYGNGGNDSLVGDEGNDSYRGGAGDDVLQDPAMGRSNDGLDQFQGGRGADSIYATDTTNASGPEQAHGGRGNDYIDTQDGSGLDVVTGNGGEDTCLVDVGDETHGCEHVAVGP